MTYVMDLEVCLFFFGSFCIVEDYKYIAYLNYN